MPPSDVHVVPFGAESIHKPINPKTKLEERILVPNASWNLDGILPKRGEGGSGWNGDLLLTDLDDIERFESTSDIHIKRFKHEEVIVVKESGLHRFPCVILDYKVFQVLTVPSPTREMLFLGTLTVRLVVFIEITVRLPSSCIAAQSTSSSSTL